MRWISLDELAKDGIHIDEFVDVLSSVNAGQSYHALGGRGKIQRSDYRGNLSRNPKFMAWTKYIPRNMTGQTRYAMAIHAFYGVAGARSERLGSADTPTAMCELPTLMGV
jgi:hypothetical protein